MREKSEFQQLGEDTRTYFDQYCTIIEPYRQELWKYCYKITGSPWDAEDLYQDTVLKLFTSLSSISHRNQVIHPKSFLYRVATNHWIDVCRKRQVMVNEYIDEVVIEEEKVHDPLELHDAFDALLQTLPPRQIVAIVLVDAFRFTIAEAAGIIGTTEGAVTSLLHRARGRLGRRREEAIGKNRAFTPSYHPLIEKYVTYFNERDFNGIAELLADEAVYSFVSQQSKEYGKHTIMNASHHPYHYERSDLHAFVRELWGRKAVVVATVCTEGNPQQLNDVLSFEMEDNKIIRMNGYYFCPDFMEQVAKELRIDRDKG